MQRKMRARLDLKGTLFNSLAITVAKREKDEKCALLVWFDSTTIEAAALFPLFIRPTAIIMRWAALKVQAFTSSLLDYYAREGWSVSQEASAHPLGEPRQAELVPHKVRSRRPAGIAR